MLDLKQKTLALFLVNCIFCGTAYLHGLAPLVGFSVGSEIYDYIKNHKAPVRITGIKGAMPNEYGVVETIIKFNPSDKTVPQGSLGTPVIIRTQKGKISSTATALLLDVKLEVPSQALDLTSAMYNLPDIITKVAGAIDPKAGAAAALIGATVEMSAQIATEQINKLLGTDEATLTSLDIFPTKYYSFNVTTNQFELKPQFKQDLETYTNILTTVIPKASQFNSINKEYIQARANYFKTYNTLELPEDATSAQDTAYEALESMYRNKLVPAFRAMAQDLLRLDQYGMHRISIMAANLKPGDLCSRLGSQWHGPFRLWVYYYLGAKLTNIFSVDFCVNTKTTVQDLLIKITPNTLDKYGNFIRGGIQFIAAKKDGSTLNPCKGNECLIGFPTIESGNSKAAPISDVYSWWDSAIISGDEGIGLAQYLIPCDISKIEQAYKDIKDTKRKAIADEALKAADMLQKALSNKNTQQQLLDPNQTSSSSSVPQGSSMTNILGIIGAIAGGGSSTGQITPTPTPAPTPQPDVPELDF